MPGRARPPVSSDCSPRLLLHLPFVLLVLAGAGFSPAYGQDRRAPDEEVVVYGERPEEVWSGVVEVRVEDREGRFLPGLVAENFVLNRGKVTVDAVAEVRYRPAVLFMIDYTVTLKERVPVPEDPHAFYAELMGKMCERFPGGASALRFLMAQGVARGTFLVDGEESAWIGNEGLARLLARDPGALFPSKTTPIVPWGDKHLTEALRWVAGRFDEIDDPAFRRFLVLLSDGNERDPAYDYDMLGYPPFWVGSGPCAGRWPWVRARKVERESRLGDFLTKREIHPLFVFRPLDVLHRVYLWDRHPAWVCAAEITRTRARHLARRSEGAGLKWRPLDPEAAQTAIAAEINHRLSRYWIAWSTPKDMNHGETFLNVEVRSRPSGKAVPDRIGEEMLLGGDPYLVRHLGPHELMPWGEYGALFPEHAVRLERLAEKVDAHQHGAAWQPAPHCPFVPAAGARQTGLGPLLLSAYRQTHDPPAGSLEHLWSETESFLTEPGMVDLCLYAARLRRASR